MTGADACPRHARPTPVRPQVRALETKAPPEQRVASWSLEHVRASPARRQHVAGVIEGAGRQRETAAADTECQLVPQPFEHRYPLVEISLPSRRE